VKIVKLTFISSIVSLNLMAVDMGGVMSEVAKTNPQVIQKMKDYNAVYESLQMANGDFLPSVDLSAGVFKVHTDRTKPKKEDNTYTNRSLTLKATENLFNGYGTVNEIDAKKASLASAAFSYLQTVNEMSLNGAKAYLDLVRHRDLLNVEIDNFNKHKKIMKAITARSKAGVGVVGDAQEITAKTNLAYANYLAESKNLKASQIAINRILGRTLDVNTLVSPDVGDVLTYTLPQAIEFALKHNPSLFVQKYNVIQARYNQKRDEKAFLPKVDVSVAKSYGKGKDDDTGLEKKYEQLSGGVSLNWNLFNGFKDMHNKQKNISLIQSQQEKYNDVKRGVIQECQLAWMSYKMQEKEYAYLTKYLTNAKAKLDTNTKLFQIGKKSLFEFLASQTDYNNAKEKLINTKYDLVFAKLKVLKALGILADMTLPDAKQSIGITGDGLFDYKAMTYKADTLPPREEELNTQGSVVVNDLVSFDSYGIVAPSKDSAKIKCNDSYENDETYKKVYDEEYIAPRSAIKRRKR